jgi:hypothetical protein
MLHIRLRILVLLTLLRTQYSSCWVYCPLKASSIGSQSTLSSRELYILIPKEPPILGGLGFDVTKDSVPSKSSHKSTLKHAQENVS